MTFFFSLFWRRGQKSSNTVFENDTLALLCMLTTSMLLSCFGFIVIVRHSMQVYNYFLIKTQCVLCFYKWWPLVWLGWGVGGPHCPRVACQCPRLWFHGGTLPLAYLEPRKQHELVGQTFDRLLAVPLLPCWVQLPWLDWKLMGPTDVTRVPPEEGGRFQGQRWWGEGQDEQWCSHSALRL